MEFNDYLFRSHFVGQIISVPKPLTANQKETLEAYKTKEKLSDKQQADFISLQHKDNESKVFKLTDGAKKILNRIVFYENHGRRTLLDNQYLEKGLRVEKASRDLISECLGIPLVYDDERRSNKWVTGKRDINTDGVVIDIKSKWNFDTFSDSLIDSSSEIYLRQLDCYMDLWDCKESILCHVLIDTPLDMVEKQIKYAAFKDDLMTLEGDIKDEAIESIVSLVSNSIYTREGLELFCEQSSSVYIEWFNDFVEIPIHKRVHMVAHSLDPIRLEQRNECIRLAREYMNTVTPINNILKVKQS